jgi:hypothetical protein
MVGLLGIGLSLSEILVVGKWTKQKGQPLTIFYEISCMARPLAFQN